MENLMRMTLMLLVALAVLVIIQVCMKSLHVETFVLFTICVVLGIFLTYGVGPICAPF